MNFENCSGHSRETNLDKSTLRGILKREDSKPARGNGMHSLTGLQKFLKHRVELGSKGDLPSNPW